MTFLSHRSAIQDHCSLIECGVGFTEGHRGLACSACRTASYCSSTCQKLHWPQHRGNCKVMREARRAQREDTPLQDRRPNIAQDLMHFFHFSQGAILWASRSALKIGRPDSLAGNHYLRLDLTYRTPPVARWSRTSAKPTGDERELFKMADFWAESDSNLDKGDLIASSEKQEYCERMGTSNVSTVILVMITAIQPEDATNVGGLCHYLRLYHLDSQLSLSFKERKLNPYWQFLLPLYVDYPLMHDTDDKALQDTYAKALDFVMSDLKLLDELPMTFVPKGGWEAMREWVARKILSHENYKVPPEIQDLHQSLLRFSSTSVS